MFMLLGPNTGLGHNSVVWMVECQVNYVMQCIDRMICTQGGRGAIHVKPSAVDGFMDRIKRAFQGKVWMSGCASWYLNAEGHCFTLWPESTWSYWLGTRRVNWSDLVLEKPVPLHED
mmetsp:Transcript_46955/g.102005  ORF Transcript_46955/g.102005 Transcript_46955/m.102005 type:complete len:117 (+) Transcript_46955:170-520(+)